MKVAQRPIGSVGHHEKGCVLFHPKIVDLYDVGMFQVSDQAGFVAEECYILACQLGAQDFDRSLCVQVNVFAQVDVSEATLAQQMSQTIVTKELSNAMGDHSLPPY